LARGRASDATSTRRGTNPGFVDKDLVLEGESRPLNTIAAFFGPSCSSNSRYEYIWSNLGFSLRKRHIMAGTGKFAGLGITVVYSSRFEEGTSGSDGEEKRNASRRVLNEGPKRKLT
jgi:hypothetical protein